MVYLGSAPVRPSHIQNLDNCSATTSQKGVFLHQSPVLSDACDGVVSTCTVCQSKAYTKYRLRIHDPDVKTTQLYMAKKTPFFRGLGVAHCPLLTPAGGSDAVCAAVQRLQLRLMRRTVRAPSRAGRNGCSATSGKKLVQVFWSRRRRRETCRISPDFLTSCRNIFTVNQIHEHPLSDHARNDMCGTIIHFSFISPGLSICHVTYSYRNPATKA